MRPCLHTGTLHLPGVHHKLFTLPTPGGALWGWCRIDDRQFSKLCADCTLGLVPQRQATCDSASYVPIASASGDGRTVSPFQHPSWTQGQVAVSERAFPTGAGAGGSAALGWGGPTFLCGGPGKETSAEG